MWLPLALVLLILPGCFTLRGPSAVSGYEGGSLTVQCHYNSGWETYVKWWCRGAVWSSCKFVVRTTGSEQEVKKDRVSIKDNQKNRIFTVTMEQLREDDADVYWCGIEKSGSDLAVQVRVSVVPGEDVPAAPQKRGRGYWYYEIRNSVVVICTPPSPTPRLTPCQFLSGSPVSCTHFHVCKKRNPLGLKDTPELLATTKKTDPRRGVCRTLSRPRT
ncbi:PREDICTED: CMRF35-like molecule 7-like [Elephantulus edwardii]|uniref:CMRF35-like molecule 7-like n=1 Tax=Elephantulus edwardii TaxID=28737 RepID=UPI0003F0BE5D|nr:PREDICTED: CMRF35-like molecule 7-like [Elephantulus edwardii]